MTHRFILSLVCGLLLVPGGLHAEEGSFDSNGVKIRYVVEGEGEPVLLIHGFVVNKELQWGLPGTIKALAKDHRVIALDNRGHGKSGKPTDPKKYGTEMVEDAVRLLDHLKIQKAHVVGYSMGAVITAKLMVTHPDRLLSATLGGAGAIREGAERPPFISALADSLDKGKGIGPLLVALTPAGKPKPPEELIKQVNRMLVGDNGKALAAVVRSWKDLTVTDAQLKANRVPALALIGEMDPLKKNVDELKDRMANLQIVVIGGTDHMTAFVSPKFVKSLQKFLNEHGQPTETVIRLTVRPASAPKPALKYQLLPELREMNPGNPIQAYSKCFAEQNNFWKSKESVEKREKWQTMPLRDLPLQDMQYYKNTGALRYADYAARLDTPDWQILLQLKSDGPTLLLPDIQGLRELGGALKVRFRVEVAERRFDAALATAKTMLGLSRHLGEHPTLIGELVGIAIANLAFGPLEEMIPQPDSPNLFWALTDLPHPFIDLRKGVQSDRLMMTDLFASIDEQAPMSDAQVQQAVDRFRRMVKDLAMIFDVSGWLNKLTKDEGHVRATRTRLIDAGLAEEKVKQFSAPQVILLDEKLEFSVWHDESRKAMNLPYWQAAAVLSAASPRKKREGSLFRWLGEMGYDKVKQAQARLDQRIALLRCVEALRLYAAEHDGKLPAKLADIALPLPVDPITGKPFVYQLDGATATVRGTPPRGMEKNAAYNVRYEVMIGK